MMTGRGAILALGTMVVIFMLSLAAGLAWSGGSPRAVQIICAAGAVASGLLLWPRHWGVAEYGHLNRGIWLVGVSMAGGLAMILAVPAQIELTPVMLRLAAAVGVMLFFLGGLTRSIAGSSYSWRSTVLAILLSTCLVAAAPLWLGPWVEVFAGLRWFTDFVIAISPLTYFAVMAEYDYLRDQWLYIRAPYGGLRFAYPGQLVSSGVYISLGAVFWLLATIRASRGGKLSISEGDKSR